MRLTASGREVARSVDPHARVIQDSIEASLGPAQLEAFVEALHRISDAMEDVGRTAPRP